MSASGRFHRPPGGETSHNLFSWADGSDLPISKGSNSEVNNQERRVGRSSVRTSANQMGSQIIFGEVDEEQPRGAPRGLSQRKLEELSGSGIFTAGPITISSNAFANNNDQNNGNYITDRPSVRLHQNPASREWMFEMYQNLVQDPLGQYVRFRQTALAPAGGTSQIMFGTEEVTPVKKLLSPLKKMELSGTSETTEDVISRKHSSERKMQEMNGSISIFSPPPEPVPPKVRMSPALSESSEEFRPTGGPKSVGGASQIVFGEVGAPEPPTRRVSEQKVKDLLGTGEFKEELAPIPVSDAKMRELQGCDIFADEPPQIRDSLGGIRQPPGGASHIALV